MDVVTPTAPAIHADPDSMVLENLREAVRCELVPLVGVEDRRRSKARYSLLESFFTETRVHAVGNPPGEYPAAIEVHYGHKVDVADSRQLDVGQVGDPHLVRVSDKLILEQVGIHRILGMPDACQFLGVQCLQMHMMHDPADLLLGKAFVSRM